MSQLNPQQQEAADALLRFVKDPAERFFIIEGPAGVGKTFLINHFVRNLANYSKVVEFLTANTGKKTKTDFAVQATATTHAAAEKLLIEDSAAQTLHRFLELTVQSDYSKGKTQLIPRYGTQGPIDQPMLVIVDEASMIDDLLLRYMHERTHPETKFVLLGDRAQLVGVSSNKAPVFTKGFPSFSLTIQERQAPNSDLGRLCLGLRESVITGVLPQFDLAPGSIEHFSDHNQWLELAKYQMKDPTWTPSASRILAWKNQTVIGYNNQIQTALLGVAHPQVGQQMISNRPVIFNGKMQVKNNQQVTIMKVCDSMSEGFAGYTIELLVNNTRVIGFMPKDPKAYQKLRRQGLAIQNQKQVAMAMDSWFDLRPVFASTVDKAQGSTYESVFINLRDLAQCRSYDRVLRMLYTGVSRAQKRVIFFGDLS